MFRWYKMYKHDGYVQILIERKPLELYVYICIVLYLSMLFNDYIYKVVRHG